MTGQAEFTESELEAVTMVFKQYETGVREACINVKDLLPALVSLGLNMVNLNSTEAGGKYFDIFTMKIKMSFILMCVGTLVLLQFQYF